MTVKTQLKSLYSLVYSRKANFSARMQITRINYIDRPFFIICIPGSLHLVDLCLRYIPFYQNIILVSNGLTNWEYKWAKENLKFDGFLHFSKMLEHGCIIDVLIKYFAKPFGILDYDCFVFDKSLFSKLSFIDSKTMLNALFMYQNPNLNIGFPETFMLYFNPDVIRIVQEKYGVNSQIRNFNDLSQNVINRLRTIGIDDKQYPEEHKSYFDTIRLWFSLGIADGYECKFVERFSPVPQQFEEIFHVGGSSTRLIINSKWEARGIYLWRRALETSANKDLQQFYWKKYGNYKSDVILRKNPYFAGKLETDFFQQIENIIDIH